MELTIAVDQLNEIPVRELTGGVEHRTTGSVHPFGGHMMAFLDGATPTLVSANGTCWRVRRQSSASMDHLRHKVATRQAVVMKASRVHKGDVFLVVEGSEIHLAPVAARDHSFRRRHDALQQLVAPVH